MTMAELAPPTLSEKAQVVSTGLVGAVRHFLAGQFNEIGYTIYLAEMASRARTRRSFAQRASKLAMANHLK